MKYFLLSPETRSFHSFSSAMRALGHIVCATRALKRRSCHFVSSLPLLSNSSLPLHQLRKISSLNTPGLTTSFKNFKYKSLIEMTSKTVSDFSLINSTPPYLKILLEERLATILPDLLLLEVDDVSHIQYNDRQISYLYTLCSMLLDCQPNHIQIYSTHDGLEPKDEEEWHLLENSAEEYHGGTYMCKCLSGILFFTI